MNQFPISDNVTMPTDGTVLCPSCGHNKPFNEFSLKKGKHSADRKAICVKCETKARKARTQFGLTAEEMDSLLKLPCRICDNPKSEFILLGENKKPIATACKECNRYLKYLGDREECLLVAHNFMVLKREFPAWLRWELSQSQAQYRYYQSTPLLDLIEEP